MTDVAYFLGCALPDRRCAATTTTRCCARTTTRSGPMPPLSLDDVREGVRRQSFFGVMMAIVVLDARRAHRARRRDVHDDAARGTASMCSTPTRWRCCPNRPRPKPLQPVRRRRGRAPRPATEPLWSESWYADFADEAAGRRRLVPAGLDPQSRTRAWVNALLCGPGIPTVAVNDFEVALPDDPGVVRTDAIELTQTATEPLRTYHVTVRAAARPTTTRPRCCGAKPGDRSSCRWI